MAQIANGRLDWFAEIVGAFALAAAAVFAAVRIGAVEPGIAIGMFAVSLGLFWSAARMVPPEHRALPLPAFEAAPEPAIVHPVDEDELLLDDPLPAAQEGSRVVNLFGGDVGAMQRRIEEHLAKNRPAVVANEQAAAPVDAGDALKTALADLRRSLRA